MVRRPHYIALLLIVLLVLIFFQLPSQTSARVKLAVSSLFLPLFGASSSVRTATDKAGTALLPRSELVRQNEQLRLENERLQLQLMRGEETARENERLRMQLEWRKQSPWEVKLARVIGRDPANWWRTIHIDLGSRDGIRPNLPVLTTSGLVGRVSTVGEQRSQVILLGDPNLRVGVVVDETRDSGVVVSAGHSPFDYRMVELMHLAGNTEIRPGHTVRTSGDGGVFPKGIVVGTVIDMRQVDFGLSSQARVRLAANLKALEEVWVMFP